MNKPQIHDWPGTVPADPDSEIVAAYEEVKRLDWEYEHTEDVTSEWEDNYDRAHTDALNRMITQEATAAAGVLAKLKLAFNGNYGETETFLEYAAKMDNRLPVPRLLVSALRDLMLQAGEDGELPTVTPMYDFGASQWVDVAIDAGMNPMLIIQLDGSRGVHLNRYKLDPEKLPEPYKPDEHDLICAELERLGRVVETRDIKTGPDGAA